MVIRIVNRPWGSQGGSQDSKLHFSGNQRHDSGFITTVLQKWGENQITGHEAVLVLYRFFDENHRFFKTLAITGSDGSLNFQITAQHWCSCGGPGMRPGIRVSYGFGIRIRT